MGLLSWLFPRPVEIKANYEAARPGVNDRYWRNADSFDPELSNSRTTRAFLVPRSRHEQQNNGYYGGNIAMQANFLVGATGPQLRMQSPNKGFNRLVEKVWFEWCKAVKFRRKLWTLCHAKYQDGDGFGILRTNPRLNHKIKLDYVVFEQEMCQSPVMALRVPGKGDGIDFDEFGNPEVYYILPHHPGGPWGMISPPERVPARFVTHWFKSVRPGQTRGVPANSATLNLGAQARRHRLATLQAAESAAGHTVLFETDKNPEDVAQIEIGDTYEILPGMAQPTPAGWHVKQMQGEHPTTEYMDFHRQLLGEGMRPLGMPVNLALGDSSQASYASSRMDMLPWFKTLDVERADCDDLVMEPLWSQWWAEAVLRYGWPAEPQPKVWDWPSHPIVDREAEAKANDLELKNGSTTLHRIYAERGLDFEDEVEKIADSMNLTEDEVKERLAEILYAGKPEPPTPPGGSAAIGSGGGPEDSEA